MTADEPEPYDRFPTAEPLRMIYDRIARERADKARRKRAMQGRRGPYL